MLLKKQTHKEVGNQEYRNYIQPLNQDVYEIFNDRIKKIIPDWNKLKILDFGCNIGNLLETSNGAIDQKNYTGVDINKESLAIARTKFPEANWIYYPGYNSTFNPYGDKNSEFYTDEKFDIIIIYGVFTHFEIGEIKNKLELLKKCLKENGLIVFSIWETGHFQGYLTFLRTCFNINLESLSNLANEALRSIYLINREKIIVDRQSSDIEDCQWLETFYQKDYFLKQIPDCFFMNGIYSHHSIFGMKST